MVVMVCLSCGGQPGPSRFCLVKATLVLVLVLVLLLVVDHPTSTVHLSWFGALASPRLVLVIWKVFLVLEPQSLRLLNEGPLFCLRKKSEDGMRVKSVKGLFKLQHEHLQHIYNTALLCLAWIKKKVVCVLLKYQTGSDKFESFTGRLYVGDF